MTLFLYLSTAFIAAAIVSALAPLRLMIILSGALATLQLYTLPIAGVFFSVSHLGGLGAWKSILDRTIRLPRWFYLALILIIWQLLSSIWSPNRYLAIRQVLYWLPFIFVIPAVLTEARRNQLLIERIICFLLISTLIQVALVVIFRFFPLIEGAFLSSPFANVFISPNVLGDLRSGAYTVFDSGKAGGFFVNANVAATYMGMSAFLAWGFGRATGRRWLYWIAAANLIATLLTGSKAGALLAVALPFSAYASVVVRRGRRSIGLVATFCLVAVAVIPVILFGAPYLSESRFVTALDAAFNYRLAIWGFAWEVLMNHPILGLGFGGWEQDWPRYAIAQRLNPLMPPHNSLIALFAQGGLVAVLFAGWFCASLLGYLWIHAGRNEKAGLFASGVLFAAVWAIAQSMGENFGILGEVHITPFLALAIGYLLFLSERSSDN